MFEGSQLGCVESHKTNKTLASFQLWFSVASHGNQCREGLTWETVLEIGRIRIKIKLFTFQNNDYACCIHPFLDGEVKAK